MGDLIVLVVVAVLIGVGGVRLGMLLAPAVGRLAGPDEDEPTDGAAGSGAGPGSQAGHRHRTAQRGGAT